MSSQHAPVIYTLTTEDHDGYTDQTHHLTQAGAQAARRHVLVEELVQRAIEESDGQVPQAELLQIEAEILALDEDAFVVRANQAWLTFSVLEHVLYDYPAGHPWPGHSVTILPSPRKGDS